MNYISIEQSKKLLELGLSPDSADMIYVCSIIRGKENGFLDVVPKESILYSMYTTIEEKEKSIPCWSLEALLELMPKIDNYLPSLRKCNDYYCVVYSDDVTRFGDKYWQNGKTPIEAAYNMVIWLLENNYIKKDGNT